LAACPLWVPIADIESARSLRGFRPVEIQKRSFRYSPAFSLTAIDIAAGCVIFFVGEVLLSYLFFRLSLRDRRY
ncbi:MAG: hypothetical protein WB685_18850, partial [Pseudolabrys sp.]